MRWWMVVNAALLAATALAIVTVEVWDRPAASVEASVRRYASAVANADLNGALAEIAPAEREASHDFVQSQLGNVYAVTGIAVRTRWLFGPPIEVTANLDINRGYPDEFYQASPRVGIVQADGRWYLAAPLLAPS